MPGNRAILSFPLPGSDHLGEALALAQLAGVTEFECRFRWRIAQFLGSSAAEGPGPRDVLTVRAT
jgi:hypothetical protein